MSGQRGPLPANLKIGGAHHLAVVPNGDSKTQESAAETAAAKLLSGLPDKPKRMPQEASDMWDQMVPPLHEAGLISKVDAAVLALACRHYAAAVKASNSLMRGSITLHDKKNARSMKNPASQVFRDHSSAFLELAKQSGLTLVSRARIPMDDGEGGSNGDFFD